MPEQHRVLHQGRLGVATVTAYYGPTLGVSFAPDGEEAAPTGERWTQEYLRRVTNAAYDHEQSNG